MIVEQGDDEGNLGYKEWATEAFMVQPGLELSQQIPLADPDGDGLSNLIEYGMNLSPVTFGSNPFNIEVMEDEPSDGRRIELSFPWKKDAKDLSFDLEESEDLADWSTVQAAVRSLPFDEVTNRVTLEVPVLKAKESVARFYRLRITLVAAPD